MRSFLTGCMLCLLICKVSAQTYSFKPAWKKGVVKTISIIQNEREFKNDELISDTTIYNSGEVKVLSNSKETVKIELKFENQALIAASNFYDKLGEEYDDYRHLKLQYALDKSSGELELLNWEEAQDFMLESIHMVTALIEEKVPEAGVFAKFAFDPIEEGFSGKENIEKYMESQFSYLFIPFGKEFVLGETISVTETEENPFNSVQELSATTNLTLSSVNKKSNECVFQHNIELDLSEFIEMMKTMFTQMMSLADSTKDHSNKLDGLDDFEMNMDNLLEIHYNSQTTWVTKAISTSAISGTNPKTGDKERKEVITTFEIK